MINYYFVFVQLQYVIFKLWDSCYNTLVQKRDLKYSIIIYSTIPLVNIFFWTTFSRRNRNFFTKKKGEKKLIGESLREEMVIRTIGKRKFHEESFSFDFFSFFFFYQMIQSTPYSKLRPVSTEAIIKDNQFLLVSFHWNPNEGWMESWKPIKHRTMSRVGCRRITPSDYPLKRKRKLEIATVGTVDIFVSFRL